MTATIQRVPRDLPAPTSAANMARRMSLCLASQIGLREGRDSDGDWNNDNPFGLYFKQNRVSWCNWFQSWGAVVADIPASVIPRTGYTPASWNWFVDRNRDVKTPQAGDLFWVYGWVPSEGQSRVHHIGFVEKVLSGGRIQTIEGNTNTSGSSQGNGVYRLTRTVSSKLRFARPNYAAAVQTVTPKPPAKPPVTKPPAGDTIKPPTPEDTLSAAEVQDLKNFIESNNQKYAVAVNNYVRQVLGTATKAILAASGDDDATAAVEALNAELDERDAEMLTNIQAIADKLDEPVEPATPEA
jgi:hypothetical protein